MKYTKGFTLIELIITMIIIAILGATALPKFINLRDDANLAVMEGMRGALIAANDLTYMQILIKPENVNDQGTRFTLDNGQVIKLRGGYPDARWHTTFVYLVDISSVTHISGSSSLCDADTDWCSMSRGPAWFEQRGYITSAETTGRGFVIFPSGFDNEQQACYVYFFTPNAADSTNPKAPKVEVVDSDC